MNQSFPQKLVFTHYILEYSFSTNFFLYFSSQNQQEYIYFFNRKYIFLTQIWFGFNRDNFLNIKNIIQDPCFMRPKTWDKICFFLNAKIDHV